jgi:hypothetical protein
MDGQDEFEEDEFDELDEDELDEPDEDELLPFTLTRTIVLGGKEPSVSPEPPRGEVKSHRRVQLHRNML